MANRQKKNHVGWNRSTNHSVLTGECYQQNTLAAERKPVVWKSSDDQATFDRKRSTITQINARHTWDGSSGRKFPKPVQDPGGALDGKWREGHGEPLLGSTEAPHGWRWREGI